MTRVKKTWDYNKLDITIINKENKLKSITENSMKEIKESKTIQMNSALRLRYRRRDFRMRVDLILLSTTNITTL